MKESHSEFTIYLHVKIILPKYRIFRSGLSINDIMPEDPNNYDKMRPPKKNGNPTTVYFHVTVMGLDSIDEGSMVSSFFITL